MYNSHSWDLSQYVPQDRPRKDSLKKCTTNLGRTFVRRVIFRRASRLFARFGRARVAREDASARDRSRASSAPRVDVRSDRDGDRSTMTRTTTTSASALARIVVSTCALAACVAVAALTRRAMREGEDSRARRRSGDDAEAVTTGEDEPREDESTRGTTETPASVPSSSRGGGGDFEDARAVYADAMRMLCTWAGERGYEPVTRAFRRVAYLARAGGDAHLECEATLIVAEIEINALRRMYAVMESADVEESIDASQFERITSETLRLAVENGDRVSEARAHVVVGDYYLMARRDHAAALEHYGIAREFAREEGSLPLEMEACRRMQWTQSIRGDVRGAGTLSREVVRLTRLYAENEREKNRSDESNRGDGGDGVDADDDRLMVREHWYLGGYENQEVHALKELGCALRGETRRLSRPVVEGARQREAVDVFEEALDVLDAHWRATKSSFERDAEGAAIKLSILGHLGDIFDNYLEPENVAANRARAVEYRRRHETLAPGSFGPGVACPLCDVPLGGLDVDDAPVKMTFAWDACASKHHFHAACLDARFDDSRPACPGCVAERLARRTE